MKEVLIKLTGREIQHLKQNFDCASDTCGIFYKILNKIRIKVEEGK